jgi:hypothetical protein
VSRELAPPCKLVWLLPHGPLPQRLHAAWNWISSAGEWSEALADASYPSAAHANAVEHGEQISASDLEDAIDWERKRRTDGSALRCHMGTAIAEWAQREPLDMAWTTGDGDARLTGWVGIKSGIRAIDTNGGPIWSENSSLDLPFDAYWDARSTSPEENVEEQP